MSVQVSSGGRGTEKEGSEAKMEEGNVGGGEEGWELQLQDRLSGQHLTPLSCSSSEGSPRLLRTVWSTPGWRLSFPSLQMMVAHAWLLHNLSMYPLSFMWLALPPPKARLSYFLLSQEGCNTSIHTPLLYRGGNKAKQINKNVHHVPGILYAISILMYPSQLACAATTKYHRLGG